MASAEWSGALLGFPASIRMQLLSVSVLTMLRIGQHSVDVNLVDATNKCLIPGSRRTRARSLNTMQVRCAVVLLTLAPEGEVDRGHCL